MHVFNVHDDVDEASRFHLGRQCQYSVVICSALCYSAAEYCAPVWSRSAHTSQVDVQLNSTMRLISGTLRSTPLPWLPLLTNIEPPSVRRKAASSLISLTHHCYDWHSESHCGWTCNIKSQWRHNWKSAQVVNCHLVCDPKIWQPGFDLPRQQWSLLNRFWTEQ